jgi:integrase
MGLGSVKYVSLQTARELARTAREQVVKARLHLTTEVDPLELRRARKRERGLTQAKKLTFREAANQVIASKRDEWKNQSRHERQWLSSFEMHVYPYIATMPVDEIDDTHILALLERIWRTKTETASRIRQRIEVVLDWAKARKLRTGENPARWKGHLDKLLPQISKIKKVKHFAALPYPDVPAFMAELSKREGMSARALEFTILTCARTNETRFAEWKDIDLQKRLWSIPAEKMKAKKPHRVPLSETTIELLTKIPRVENSTLIFPGSKGKYPLSISAMLELLRGMKPGAGLTVHGFRSSYRDWCAEMTSHANHIVEMSLAHRIEDGTERAYRRGDLLAKRQRLAKDWADYCRNKTRKRFRT